MAFYRMWGTAVLAIAVIVAMAGQYEKARRKYQRECQSEVSRIFATHPTNNQASPNECKDAKEYMPWGYILISWPDGVTVWALLATLGTIIYQSYQTRRSADATAESANAAYGSLTFMEAQFELTKERERARLELNVENTNLEVEVAGEDLVHLIATISVKNIGASKAFIKRTSGTLITRLRNESPGDSDDYSPLDIPEKAIAPDRDPIPIRVYCFPTSTARTFAECLEEGTFALYFFGFIEYETLGFGRRIEFEYEWRIVDRNDSLGGILGLSDPYPNSPRSARDRIVYGYWRANKESSGEEHLITDQTYTQNPN